MQTWNMSLIKEEISDAEIAFIRETDRSLCLFSVAPQLDGSKMSPDYRVPPIVMYERKDSRWTLKDKHT